MFGYPNVILYLAAVALIFSLSYTAPASGETYVRKLDNDVWVDWRLINSWPVKKVQKTFSPQGEQVHISTPIPSNPNQPGTSLPTQPPKTPIKPWCDCPEEYRLWLEQHLPNLPNIIDLGDSFLYTEPNFHKGRLPDWRPDGGSIDGGIGVTR